MIPLEEFPRLTAANHRITSPESTDYNCIAWAVEDVEHWWQPGVYWPTNLSPETYGVDVLVAAFLSLGYDVCEDGSFELGSRKIAIYAAATLYTHAARQLPNGKWTSKLGKAEDIEHDGPNDVAGGIYGEIVRFMKKSAPTSSQP